MEAVALTVLQAGAPEPYSPFHDGPEIGVTYYEFLYVCLPVQADARA